MAVTMALSHVLSHVLQYQNISARNYLFSGWGKWFFGRALPWIQFLEVVYTSEFQVGYSCGLAEDVESGKSFRCQIWCYQSSKNDGTYIVRVPVIGSPLITLVHLQIHTPTVHLPNNIASCQCANCPFRRACFFGHLLPLNEREGKQEGFGLRTQL